MSFPVRWSRAAVADVEAIWDYIAASNIPAADRQIDRIASSISLLSTTPLIGRARNDVQDDLRGLAKDDYLLLYRLTEENLVEIIRILHQRRDLAALFDTE